MKNKFWVVPTPSIKKFYKSILVWNYEVFGFLWKKEVMSPNFFIVVFPVWRRSYALLRSSSCHVEPRGLQKNIHASLLSAELQQLDWFSKCFLVLFYSFLFVYVFLHLPVFSHSIPNRFFLPFPFSIYIFLPTLISLSFLFRCTFFH